MNSLSPSLPHDCKVIICENFQETEGIYSVNQDFRDFFYKKLKSETDQKIGLYQKNLILEGFPLIRDNYKLDFQIRILLEMRKNENIIYNTCGGKKQFFNLKTIDFSNFKNFSDVETGGLNEYMLNKIETCIVENKYIASRVTKGIGENEALLEFLFSVNKQTLMNEIGDFSLKVVIRGLTSDLRPFIVFERELEKFALLLQDTPKNPLFWSSYCVQIKPTTSTKTHSLPKF